MGNEPIKEQGTINIEAIFVPGITEVIHLGNKTMGVSEYLEKGYNPVGLFKFEVTNIGNKEM